MRTAEDVLNEHFKILIGGNKFIIAAMKEYATEACKEQVRLCLVEAGVNAPDFGKVYVAIGHAPLPELK